FCFFEAEDGIRDWSVTGVQTCALPISAALSRSTPPLPDGCVAARATWTSGRSPPPAPVPGPPRRRWPRRGPAAGTPAPWSARTRSEERRVGKEGGARAAAEHVKEREAE